MTQTDTEKELILGNKQLISLFFVVVALLGVFFAAGYMIGRKSVTPASSPAAADAGNTAPTPVAPQPHEEVATAGEGATPSDPGPGSIPETQPEVVAPKPRPTATETNPGERISRKAETAHVSEPKEDAAKEDLKRTELPVSRPEAGATYLQVTALRRPDADNLVHSLREQHFPALLAASSKEGLYRVMVGPYHETAKVAVSKGRLKALGFANAFVQK